MSEFSHFDSGSVPSWLTAMTAGSGSVAVDGANSVLEMVHSATGNAAAVHLTDPVDPTQNLLVRVALRASDYSPAPAIWLVPSASAPTPVGAATYAGAALGRIQFGTVSSNNGLTFDYWDTGGTRRQWNPSTNAWATPTVGFTTLTFNDFHELIFEVDGVNGRFRMAVAGHHNSGSSSYTENQGYKLRVLTDWVTFAGARSAGGNDLWLVIGYPLTDLTNSGSTCQCEWISVEDGAREMFTYNGRDGAGASAYNIFRGHRYGNASRGMPTERTPWVTTSGSTTENTSVQMRTHLALTDGTFVMYYSASGSTGGGIHAATYPNWDTAPTKQGLMVASVPGGNFNTIVSPFAVLDYREPDSAKRYKVICSCLGSDGKFRLYVAYAATPTGTFTLESTPLLLPGATSEFDEYGQSNPVCWWETDHWELWFSANEDGTANGWSVGRATGTALTGGAFTKDGAGSRIARQTGTLEPLTATLGGRTITVADETGFARDEMVLVDQDSNSSNWSVSRVRKLTSGSIELYHGLMGFTTATPAHVFSFLAGSVTIHDIRYRNSRWEFLCSVFGVAAQHGTINAFMENTVLFTASSLTGTLTPQWIESPTVPLHMLLGKSSAENVAFARGPEGMSNETASLGAGAATAGGRDLGVSLGALAVPLGVSAASAMAADVTILTGSGAVTLGAAAASASAADVTAVLGAIAAALGVASASATAAGLSAIAGALTVPLGAASASAHGGDVSVLVGGQLVSLGAASATALGQAVTIAVGAITVGLGAGSASALANAPIISAGGITVVLTPGVATATAVAIAINAMTGGVSARVHADPSALLAAVIITAGGPSIAARVHAMLRTMSEAEGEP